MRRASSRRRRGRRLLPLAGVAVALWGCGRTPVDPDRYGCDAPPSQKASLYVLPFPVGESATVSQGNCGPYTHQGRIRHAYDFDMEIGRTITAAREGVVIGAVQHFRDGTNHVDQTNLVEVRHADGTVGSYLHVRQDGARVSVGDLVSAGQPIALSGMSGYTGPNPHLHFQVYGCERDCDTIAVNFRNAVPGTPYGPLMGTTYTAGPSDGP